MIAVRKRALQVVFAGLFLIIPSAYGVNPVVVTRQIDGILVKTPSDQVQITVCGPSELHIIGGVTEPKPSSPHTPWILEQCGSDRFVFNENQKVATLSTAELQVSVALDTGALSFSDKSGEQLLSEEGPHARSYEPTGPPQDHIYRISERFSMPADEAIYGFGQHQTGLFNYRGSSIVLSQVNTSIAIPFFISTRGYGLIWNTAARSIANNQFPRVLKLTASAGEGLDFYFLYGPEFDQIIHHYRDLTGNAPLFGKWAYGFFQSKDRYTPQDQLEQIVDTYRSKQLPLDTVVQDWQWWTKWGSSEFNPEYPDFAAAVKNIHEHHAHVMISIWPYFDHDTPIWKEMEKHGYLLNGLGNYDVTNPGARDLYWKMLPATLLAKGVDAFWLDASEPEVESGGGGILPGQQIYFGNSALYTNIYPFLHTYGVYHHWRDTTDQKRVFILTRSSFLGQQHNAAAAWSGDVYSNFWALKRQIPAGLNFALSGMPYWTTDIGGYGYPNGDTSDPKYQEVYTRWFEFGTFCPIFRTHGHRTNNQNELWSYGTAMPTLVKFDKLRYRLLPYIYSLAWQVTHNDYTMMRPLVMDWRTDPKVWNIGNQFMFGPALLVNPVTEPGAESRSVYLPDAASWYDFWTGNRLRGGQTIQADAPLDRISLYVKAGSILPMGPVIQYASQAPNAPIELRVYRGASGSFNLYEDEGNNYDYEKGMYAVIPIAWNESTNTLTIGAREGTFPGMAKEKVFRIVWVGPNRGAGPGVVQNADREVHYVGNALEIQAQ